MTTKLALAAALRQIDAFLLKYRPLDARLRGSRTYTIFSRSLHGAYLYFQNYHPAASKFAHYSSLEVDPKVVLLDSYWGKKISCNPLAIYTELLSRSDTSFHFIWVMNRPISASKTQFFKGAQLVRYGTDAHISSLAKAGTIISNATLPEYFSPKPGQRVFSTWHGTPLKTLGFDTRNAKPQLLFNVQRSLNISENVLLPSQFARDHVLGSNKSLLPQCTLVGSPRIDLTFNTDPNEIKHLLGIALTTKVALYAPTWRESSGKARSNAKMIDEVLTVLTAELSGYKILLSTHNLDRFSRTQSSSFLQVPDSIDTNELLSAVDLLISDYSSILVDFMCLNKPGIIYAPDLSNYQRERGLYPVFSSLPFPVTTTLQDLSKELRRQRKPSSFQTFSKAIETLVPLEDGKASNRAADVILSPTVKAIRDKKKNILIYPGSLKPNGITTSVVNLLKSIDPDIFNIFVLVDSKTSGKSFEYFKAIGSHINLILKGGAMATSRREGAVVRKFLTQDTPMSRDELNLLDTAFDREARRLWGNHKFDSAIDFAGYQPYWSKLIASCSSNTKLIFQHADLMSEILNPLKRYTHLKRVVQCYNEYDRIIAVSKQLSESNKKNLLNLTDSIDRFTHTPNLLSPTDIESKSEMSLRETLPEWAFTKLDRTCAKKKILCIARLSPEKNHIRLIRAFHVATQRGLNGILLLAGAGPTLARLKKLVASLELEANVVFLGHLDNPYPLLKSSDCLVLPSDYEGQPMVLLEALALDVPYVATANPGTQSIAASYGGGKLCEPNISKLAECLMDWTPDTQARFDIANYHKEAMDRFYYLMGTT